MRLYGNSFGPGPRRVSLFLSAKGIVDFEYVQMAAYGDRSEEFLQKSPGGKIPVLELADGTCLFESQAILQYLEETYPDPPMRIDDVAGQACTDQQCHLINEYFHYFYVSAMHGSPIVSRLFDQDPSADAIARPLARMRLSQIAEQMSTDLYLAGDRPTIADFMLYALVEYTRMRFGIFLPPKLESLIAWFERFSMLPGIFPTGFQNDEDFWLETAA